MVLGDQGFGQALLPTSNTDLLSQILSIIHKRDPDGLRRHPIAVIESYDLDGFPVGPRIRSFHRLGHVEDQITRAKVNNILSDVRQEDEDVIVIDDVQDQQQPSDEAGTDTESSSNLIDSVR